MPTQPTNNRVKKDFEEHVEDHFEKEERHYAEATEDVMDFIMRSGTSKSPVGVAVHRRKVLEVSQLWGDVLVDTKHFSRVTGKNITIGTDVGWRWNFLGVDMGWVPSPLHRVLPYTPPMWSEVDCQWKDDFYASDEGFERRDHTLFEYDGDEYTAVVFAHWDGFVDLNDQRYTFEELATRGLATRRGDRYRIPITDDTRLMVDANGTVFFSHMVFEGKRLANRGTSELDFPLLTSTSLMAFLGALLLFLGLFRPGNGDLIAVNDIPERFNTFARIEHVQEPEPTPKQDEQQTEQGGEPAPKEAGEAGDKKAQHKKARGDVASVNQQMLNRQIAENAGLLGAFQDSSMDALLGNSGLSTGLTSSVGGLLGVKGAQFGSNGLGPRGRGLGGGGEADSLGSFTYGAGPGSAHGSPGPQATKNRGGIGVTAKSPVIIGALPRSVIEEEIKRNMRRIRYCYQRQLNQHPTLAGKVVIKFTISKDGTVASASKKSSSLNNREAEGCIRKTFMQMKFPVPQGGGIVIVSYPFMFSPQ